MSAPGRTRHAAPRPQHQVLHHRRRRLRARGGEEFRRARHSLRLPGARAGHRRLVEHRHALRRGLRDHPPRLLHQLHRLRRPADAGPGLSGVPQSRARARLLPRFCAHVRNSGAYRVRPVDHRRSRRRATAPGQSSSPASRSLAAIAASSSPAGTTTPRACRSIPAPSPARSCTRAPTGAPGSCATGACWWWAAATRRPISSPMPCTAARRCS